jgi:hypothetical protein
VVPTAAADSDEADECRKHKSCRAWLGHNCLNHSRFPPPDAGTSSPPCRAFLEPP